MSEFWTSSSTQTCALGRADAVVARAGAPHAHGSFVSSHWDRRQPLVACARARQRSDSCRFARRSGKGPQRGGPPRKRAARAPPQRPDQPDATAAQQEQPASGGSPATLEGELVQLPDGKHYDSLDENDGPTGEILEDEQLIGVDDKCPADSAGATIGGSSTRAATVITHAQEQAKALTKKQSEHAADMSKWSPLKTDGTELRRFPRPAFLPFKAGTERARLCRRPRAREGRPAA